MNAIAAPNISNRRSSLLIRESVATVGNKSTVPYGPTNGYATPNGVTGFIGPAAGSLQRPSTWYVRSGGSNNNGGSSTSLTPDRTGTDGVEATTTTFISASAAFTKADNGKGICINTGAGAERYKIVAVNSASTITLNRAAATSGSGKTWAIGGAWADKRAVVGDSAITSANAGSGVQSGDTVYIGAGVYRVVTAIPSTPTTPFSFNGQVNIVGDVTGQFTGDAGMVQLTAYTTNDKTAPSATTLLNLNGKSNLAFSNIMFVGGSATTGIVTATTLTSQNIIFLDCAFLTGVGGKGIMNITSAFKTSLNWMVDRCRFMSTGTNAAFTLTLTTGVGSDYDINFLIQNSFLNSDNGANGVISINSGGALANKGGGVRVLNSFFKGGSTAMRTLSANLSILIPCSVTNSFLYIGDNAALSATTLGQIVEDYNLIVAATPRTNVNIGLHSISDGSYAPLFHFEQERIWGGLQRAFGEPMAGSPLLGFGGDGGQTLYDLMNRPRPAGGFSALPAVGALERSNTAAQVQSPAPPSGTNIWQFTGPGYEEFTMSVQSGQATTIAVSVQRDAGYSGGALGMPQMQILGNPTIGVASQIVADSGASGGWNTLTSSTFTPTANGVVTVRIFSDDATGSSIVSFADFVVT